MKKVLILFTFISLFIYSNAFPQLGWFFQNSGTTTQFCSIKFFNSSTAWAVGWNQNIFKTTNGGTNWMQIYSGNNVTYQSIHVVNNNVGYVVGQSGIIIKTTNGGNNWVTQPSGTSSLLMYVNFVNELTGWAAGYGGVLLKTTNGGTNWVVKPSGVTTNLLCVYFLNSNLGFISGDNGTIKRSTDGGNSWTNIPTPLTYNLDKFFFIDNNTGWVTGINGTVLKTTNSGLSWLFTYTGVTSWITAVHFFDIYTGYACGGEYGNPSGGIILKTINGGISWTPTTHPSIPWMAFINFVSPDTGWAVGQNGLIMKTIDGGNPPPSAPSLISPVHNAILGGTLTPTLTWGTALGATSYTYQVSRLGVMVDSGTVIGTTHIIPSGCLAYNNTYQWKVKASNVAGSSQWSTTWSFTVVVTNLNSISSTIPDKFNLYQNYPNPFNPSTNIKFDVPTSSEVKLVVYDLSGKEVEKLYSGNIQAGKFEYKWNASNYSSGIYFAKLESKDFTGIKRMMLVK